MRWHAVVHYRSNSGSLDVDFYEISDLEYVIESGPHWGAIEQIVITYHGCAEQLTLEQAATA